MLLAVQLKLRLEWLLDLDLDTPRFVTPFFRQLRHGTQEAGQEKIQR